MPDFNFISLTEEIDITDIITIHYFEYMNDFYFPGEHHDFWEFLCVDKGEVIVMADEQEHILKKGDIIFHKPNEFHNVRANDVIAPNLVVIAFHCDSPAMEFFHDRILKIGETQRTLLACIITEAQNAFSSPLDNPYQNVLKCCREIPFGSLQLIKTYLEQLLIGFIRKNDRTYGEALEEPLKTVKKRNDRQLYEQLCHYMEENLHRQLTLEEICGRLLISSSQVQRLFSRRHGCGIIHYFSQMKIDAAKTFIRESNMNFTQISEKLGYTSVHYFSRQFKKLAGMTPSEYAYSIKSLSEVKNPSAGEGLASGRRISLSKIM